MAKILKLTVGRFEDKEKCRSLVYLSFSPDLPTETINNPVNNTQSNSCAGKIFFGVKPAKGSKQLGSSLPWESNPVIPDIEDLLRAVFKCPKFKG